MRIKLLSDLHSEFHSFRAQHQHPEVADDEYDVLVLAGDIGLLDTEPDAAERAHYHNSPWVPPHVTNVVEFVADLAAMAGERPVVYVTGNHEYFAYGRDRSNWHFTIGTVDRKLAKTLAKFENVHFLHKENPTVEILGKRFHGSTGWYPNAKALGDRVDWVDFDYVSPASIQAEHQAWREHLTAHLREGDIVVSHMLPCYAAVSSQWVGSPSNVFFNSGFDDLIFERGPSLWLFGHTHDSVNKLVDKTRIVANPYGYWPRSLNRGYDSGLVLEV